ncbi:hypothetical protein PHLCEN_2v7659 [Hermanssonia centrifuga]|uniref:Uncharacterized protein n=1 Tax=Hermanssonia centrifuga TaxID=98765 RepID=A0A2R6NVY1_9APHY|nr:hypothetical protein PHLCEN_2v7659 [Hermanssonia centrifuga]
MVVFLRDPSREFKPLRVPEVVGSNTTGEWNVVPQGPVFQHGRCEGKAGDLPMKTWKVEDVDFGQPSKCIPYVSCNQSKHTLEPYIKHLMRM